MGEEAKFIERVDKITALLSGQSQGVSGSVIINGSGIVSVVIGLVGLLAICVAVSSVLIVAAWRSADMRELEALRAQTHETASATRVNRTYINKHESDIAELKAK